MRTMTWVAGVAALLCVGCEPFSESVNAQALQGTWEHRVQGQGGVSYLFSETAGPEAPEEVQAWTDVYLRYQLAEDGEPVLVQAGHYEVERRTVKLVYDHEVDVLVTTVLWDAEGVPSGTSEEQAIVEYQGWRFDLTDLSLGGAGQRFWAVDGLR